MRRITRRLRRGFKRTSEALIGIITLGLLKGMRLIETDRIADFAGWMARTIGPLLRENRIGRANLTSAFPEKSKAEIDASSAAVGTTSAALEPSLPTWIVWTLTQTIRPRA